MRVLAGILFVSTMAAAQAGAQVTVGAASSTTSGTTTTVTIPVTVATAAASTTTSTTAAANYAKFDATVGNANGSDVLQTLKQAFTTIALPNVSQDTAGAWNAATNQYFAPVAGTYMVITRVRFVDGTAAGISYGQGPSTANTDGPFFLWTTTAGLRNVSVNFRLIQLNKGDAVDLFTYVDSGSGAKLNYASMTIEQVQ